MVPYLIKIIPNLDISQIYGYHSNPSHYYFFDYYTSLLPVKTSPFLILLKTFQRFLSAVWIRLKLYIVLEKLAWSGPHQSLQANHSYPPVHSLSPIYICLPDVSEMHQACDCLRTFALAITFAVNALPLAPLWLTFHHSDLSKNISWCKISLTTFDKRTPPALPLYHPVPFPLTTQIIIFNHIINLLVCLYIFRIPYCKKNTKWQRFLSGLFTDAFTKPRTLPDTW